MTSSIAPTPSMIPTTRTRVNATSLNVYIRMGDPTGRRVVSFDQRDHMRRAIPRLAAQLTGQPYRGVIEDGIGDRKRPGWITVRFVTSEERPQIAEGRCGAANVGANPGNIWIIRRARGNKLCVDDAIFPKLFAHEYGHALGFFHVGNRTAVMEGRSFTGRATFTDREQYHAQLAYEAGPMQSYRGWPFGSLGGWGAARNRRSRRSSWSTDTETEPPQTKRFQLRNGGKPTSPAPEENQATQGSSGRLTRPFVADPSPATTRGGGSNWERFGTPYLREEPLGIIPRSFPAHEVPTASVPLAA